MVCHWLQTSLLLTATFGLSACNEDKPQAVPPTPTKPKPLVFSESDEFYRQLETALVKGRKVNIRFDGRNKIGKDSKLLKREFLERLNTEEFWKMLHSMDKPDGRQLLESAFEGTLLGHTKADETVAKNSDNVVAPLVVVLVIVALVLTAGVAVAKDGKAKLRIKVAANPPAIELEVEPANAPRA